MKRNLLLFLGLVIISYFAVDFQLVFDDSKNRLTFISLSLIPLDFVSEHRFSNGKIESKAIRIAERITLTYFDSLGIMKSKIKGNAKDFSTEKTTFNSNGKITEVAKLKDGLFHGERKIYNELEEVDKVENYREGQIIGFINNNAKLFYPYIDVSYDERRTNFTIKFDIGHIKIGEKSIVKINYDFTETTGTYYTPRYTIGVDTTEVTIELDYKFDNKAFEIYYNLEIDELKHPTIAKKLVDMLD